VVGAAAFGWMLASAVAGQVRTLWGDPHRAGRLAMLSGALAYLVTAVGGHPFLVPEVAVPFWMVLGLFIIDVVALRASKWPRTSSIAIASILLVTIPFRPGSPRFSPGENDDGLGQTRTDEHHRPFRELRDFGSVFVGPTVTTVEIPMRNENPLQPSAIVGIAVPGSRSSQLAYVGRTWSNVLVKLPHATPLMPRQRINLALQNIQLSPMSTAHGVYIGTITIVTAE
jgi:hypothetical protein